LPFPDYIPALPKIIILTALDGIFAGTRHPSKNKTINIIKLESYSIPAGTPDNLS
jgi:hypothetical protein